jgi:hypothetical protein
LLFSSNRMISNKLRRISGSSDGCCLRCSCISCKHKQKKATQTSVRQAASASYRLSRRKVTQHTNITWNKVPSNSLTSNKLWLLPHLLRTVRQTVPSDPKANSR